MLITNESAAHQRIANKRGLNEETYHWLCRDTALKLTDAPVAHDSGMGGQFNVSNHLISLSRTDAAYQHPFCFPQRITRTRKLRTSNHAQNHSAPFAVRQYRSLSTHPFSSSALGKSIVLCHGSYWPTRRGHGWKLLIAAEGHGRNRTPREPYRCHRVSYRCREKQESDLQPKKRRPSQYVPFVPSLKKIHISSYRRLYLKNRNIFPV